MQLHPLFIWGNAVEALLWISLSVLAIATSRRTRSRRWSLGLAAALFLFGVSDLVETQTGAWYDPWWLLAWKATCIAGILACGIVVLRERRRRAAGRSGQVEAERSRRHPLA